MRFHSRATRASLLIATACCLQIVRCECDRRSQSPMQSHPHFQHNSAKGYGGQHMGFDDHEGMTQHLKCVKAMQVDHLGLSHKALCCQAHTAPTYERTSDVMHIPTTGKLCCRIRQQL